MRTSSTSSDSLHNERVNRDGAREPRARPPAPKAEVQQFRELMGATERRPMHAQPRSEEMPRHETLMPRKSSPMHQEGASAEAALLAQAGRLASLPPAAAAAATAPTAPSAGLADLIERHVRQMLVNEDALHGGRDARVMLKLGDGALAGAELVLTRRDGGWLLHADVGSGREADTLRQCAPELVKRFAASGLGDIAVEAESKGS